MSDLLIQLGSAVGAEHVTPGADGLSVQGVAPHFVVAPGSVEELSEAMKIAAAARAAVIPWGGGTRQALGTPPSRSIARSWRCAPRGSTKCSTTRPMT